jgi:hypothetical protein
MTDTKSHQSKSAATRKLKNPLAFVEMGKRGAKARHNKNKAEESAIAKRAAAKRKAGNPDTFREMGRLGGKAPHVTRGRKRQKTNVGANYGQAANDMKTIRSANTSNRSRNDDVAVRSASNQGDEPARMSSGHYRREED